MKPNASLGQYCGPICDGLDGFSQLHCGLVIASKLKIFSPWSHIAIPLGSSNEPVPIPKITITKMANIFKFNFYSPLIFL